MTPIIGGTGVIRGSPEFPNCSGGFQNAISTAVLGVSSKSTSWPASGLMRGPSVMMPARSFSGDIDLSVVYPFRVESDQYPLSGNFALDLSAREPAQVDGFIQIVIPRNNDG